MLLMSVTSVESPGFTSTATTPDGCALRANTVVASPAPAQAIPAAATPTSAASRSLTVIGSCPPHARCRGARRPT